MQDRFGPGRSRGTPAKHRERNIMDKLFEAVVVELKN